VTSVLEQELSRRGLEKEIQIVHTGCNGYCAEGPVMAVYPEEVFYQNLNPADIPMLVEEHFLKGRPYEKLLYKDPVKKTPIPYMKDIPFFKHQAMLVMRNKGFINPEKLEDYIARDGYQALANALTRMEPKDIVHDVTDSGLRGRGGSGFQTGLKWDMCAKTDADQKYILANGSAAIKDVDRALMELDPHSIIEGMIIGARAIGASKGYIYVRSDYSVAIRHLQTAIDQCYEAGLLGSNILYSGFDFDLEIFKGGGAFVCGEATALMRSIEGKRGMPSPKLWHAAVKGLWGKPTILNNVETLANIPQIILNGPGWYRSFGTEKSAGTKVFSVTGTVHNVGLVEVPMNTTLRKIIYDIGGGIKKKGRKFKAVHLGGPLGGCIPEKLLDMRVSYEDIRENGVIVGSGGLVVMDDSTCMVNTAKYFLDYTAKESCGKCVPCRVGTKVLNDLLKDITEGRGKEGDIELIQDLSGDMIEASLCGLGRSAPTPVLSTMKHFGHEYEMHIHDKWCTAGICKDLSTFFIDARLCKGCGACLKACPADAVSGDKKKPHRIDQERCVHCRTCWDSCKFNSIKILPAAARDAGEAELEYLADRAAESLAWIEKMEVIDDRTYH
jgi:NADH:ubiquinone oxidoreductase subunit F (NADH-binding)/(2Fe-2S) ferredoxin